MTITGGKEEYGILDCSYSFYRNTDSTGKPTQFARAGSIQISKYSTDDSPFFEWAASKSESKDGTITFYDAADKSMRKLDFKGGVVTSYEETASSEGGMNMMERISIYAKTVSSSGATVNNEESK